MNNSGAIFARLRPMLRCEIGIVGIDRRLGTAFARAGVVRPESDSRYDTVFGAHLAIGNVHALSASTSCKSKLLAVGPSERAVAARSRPLLPPYQNEPIMTATAQRLLRLSLRFPGRD